MQNLKVSPRPSYQDRYKNNKESDFISSDENNYSSDNSEESDFENSQCSQNKQSALIGYIPESSAHNQHNLSESINENAGGSIFTFQNNIIIIICIAFISIIVNGVFKLSVDEISEKHNLYLREQFSLHENPTWDDIKAVLKDAKSINPPYPAVFLFLYKDHNDTVNKVVNLIGKYASKQSKSENFILMDEDDLRSDEALEDYGYIINKYRDKIQKNKVLLTYNLQNIPGRVALAYHTLCDEISPLVREAVYIFTMRVDELEGSAVKIAEDHLKKQWSEVDFDELLPLITRVTSTVIKM